MDKNETVNLGMEGPVTKMCFSLIELDWGRDKCSPTDSALPMPLHQANGFS